MPEFETFRVKKRHARRGNRGRKLSMRGGKAGVRSGKRSDTERRSLQWKFGEKGRGEMSEFGDDRNEAGDEKVLAISRGSERGRKEVKAVDLPVAVSVRKLGSELWSLQLPEVDGDEMAMIHQGVKSCGGGDRLGFQPSVGRARQRLFYHCNRRKNEGEADEFLNNPHFFSTHRNGFFSKLEPSFRYSNFAMGGATKWDSVRAKTDDDDVLTGGCVTPRKQKVTDIQIISVIEAKLKQAHARVHELETEQTLSKKKLERFMGKLSEERSEWRRREHEKFRSYNENLKAELKRETKIRQRVEIINSKLANELAETKQSAKQFMHGFEKERKARKLMEQACEELANNFSEDKAQIEDMKRDACRIKMELEKERQMLQLAEVWREERVQMKLVDAKVVLEEQYSQMKQLVADLNTFLLSTNATHDVNEIKQAETLLQAASSINIQEITNFSYEPTNHDDFMTVFQEVNAEKATKQNVRRPYSIDSEADDSEWNTLSHVEDIDSSNVSQSETDWEFNVDEEARLSAQLKRTSYPNNGEEIHKIILLDGLNGRLSNGRKSNASLRSQEQGPCKGNGRISNVSARSQDLGSSKGGPSPKSYVKQWIATEVRNPNNAEEIGDGNDLLHGVLHKSWKAKHMEARTESKKLQLRQILKQKL